MKYMKNCIEKDKRKIQDNKVKYQLVILRL